MKRTRYSQAKQDCFAYLQREGYGVCTALDALYCRSGKPCKFYKPLAEHCGQCKEISCDNCLAVDMRKRPVHF